jgi:cytochrome c oxidase assembly factor CtaG
LFIAFCTIITLGSPSLLLTYWHDYRAAFMVGVMILIVSIPGLIELALTQWRLSQTSPTQRQTRRLGSRMAIATACETAGFDSVMATAA